MQPRQLGHMRETPGADEVVLAQGGLEGIRRRSTEVAPVGGPGLFAARADLGRLPIGYDAGRRGQASPLRLDMVHLGREPLDLMPMLGQRGFALAPRRFPPLQPLRPGNRHVDELLERALPGPQRRQARVEIVLCRCPCPPGEPRARLMIGRSQGLDRRRQRRDGAGPLRGLRLGALQSRQLARDLREPTLRVVPFVAGIAQGGVDARSRLDQRAQPPHRRSGQDEALRLGLPLALDPLQDAGDLQVELAQLQPAFGDVLVRGDVARPQLGQPLQPPRLSKCGLVDDGRVDLGAQPRDLLAAGLTLDTERDLVLPQRRHLGHPAGRSFRQPDERG